MIEINSRKRMGTYAQLRRRFYRIKEQYPFAEYTVCSRTRTGRALFTLGLGNMSDVVIYLGCTDGVSPQASFALMKVFEDMCRAYSNNNKLNGIKIKNVLDEKGVIFVPCVNPDAVEINAEGPVAAGNYTSFVESRIAPGTEWRANAAGIDLGFNISSDFTALTQLANSVGYTAPGARYYAGKTPVSEPETMGVARLCRNSGVRHIIEIGKGNNELYSAGREFTEKSALIAEILRLSSSCSIVEKSKSLDAQHGFADWFSSSFQKPAFSLFFGDFVHNENKRLSETVVLSAVM